MRIAVMQPYFFPYGGYFRLIAAVDLFILFDCVQFPRRGRVHRTEAPTASGAVEWLTLPLAPAKREARICDLRFAEDAFARWRRAVRRMAWFESPASEIGRRLRALLEDFAQTPTAYLERTLRWVADAAGVKTPFLASSSFALPADLRGQDRILAIADRLGAKAYLNAPGGRALYDPAAFAAAGVRLEFLSAYDGPYRYMLPALFAAEGPAGLPADARAFRIEPA